MSWEHQEYSISFVIENGAARALTEEERYWHRRMLEDMSREFFPVETITPINLSPEDKQMVLDMSRKREES